MIQYVAFVRWLSFRAYRQTAMPVNSRSGEPSKKRRRTIAKSVKNYRKDFDPSPSELTDRLPSSQKSIPFKSMVAQWWLDDNPDFKTLDVGGEWLVGFYRRLKEDELHPTDWEHLKELNKWHEEKEEESSDNTQAPAGPSSQIMPS